MQITNNNLSKIKNKRVVLLLDSLELGGAEKRAFILARYLRESCGAFPEIWGLTSSGDGRIADLCISVGIPCKGIELKRPVTRYDWILCIINSYKILSNSAPHILISYTKLPNIISGLIWRICGIPLFIWNQGDEGLGLGRKLLDRISIFLTLHFVSNSCGGKSFLIDTFGISESKVEIIHNGILLDTPAASRSDWRNLCGLDDNEYVACMVANISKFKDHVTLLKAWQKIKQLSPLNHCPVLLLAGRFDGTECELLKLSAELQLGDRVRFIGSVSDIAGLLGAVDLFVFSSKSEGLPNAVIEAMAAGLPVVGTDIPGIREALGPQAYRFLALPGDSNGLARIILDLINDPNLCAEYSKMLMVRASSEFSLQLMLKHSARYISSLIYNCIKN